MIINTSKACHGLRALRPLEIVDGLGVFGRGREDITMAPNAASRHHA